MNYQSLILTCECGYRTPESGRNGWPLTERRARRAYRDHRRRHDRDESRMVPCMVCGTARQLTRYYDPSPRCLRCALVARSEEMRDRHSQVDEMAVERLLSGSMVQATRAERQAAITYLTGHGLSAREIAERIRVSSRTVQRLRSRAAA